jgi:hypothetical protein
MSPKIDGEIFGEFFELNWLKGKKLFLAAHDS